MVSLRMFLICTMFSSEIDDKKTALFNKVVLKLAALLATLLNFTQFIYFILLVSAFCRLPYSWISIRLECRIRINKSNLKLFFSQSAIAIGLFLSSLSSRWSTPFIFCSSQKKRKDGDHSQHEIRHCGNRPTGRFRFHRSRHPVGPRFTVGLRQRVSNFPD